MGTAPSRVVTCAGAGYGLPMRDLLMQYAVLTALSVRGAIAGSTVRRHALEIRTE